MSRKFPIASLPLPPSSHILTHNLTPDPAQPSVQEFFENLKTKPSAQRRSRQLHHSSHFSYVAPLPLPFPYQVTAPEDEDADKTEVVESWLSKHEPLLEVPSADAEDASGLKKYTAKDGVRDQNRTLLAISAAGVRDCLPHLDIGDALDYVGPGSLSQSNTTGKAGDEKESTARQELVDVLSGHSVLMRIPEGTEEKGFAPWSLRYSGHQFGSWAGQLGDGRAISLRESCPACSCVCRPTLMACDTGHVSGDATPRRSHHNIRNPNQGWRKNPILAWR